MDGYTARNSRQTAVREVYPVCAIIILGLFVVLDILDREGGAVDITIGASVVLKQFKCANAVRRVSELVEIYDLLKEKKVPYVDSLRSFKLESNPPHVYLEPVGVHRFPASGSEAFSAVVCVLKALKVRYDVFVFIF